MTSRSRVKWIATAALLLIIIAVSLLHYRHYNELKERKGVDNKAQVQQENLIKELSSLYTRFGVGTNAALTATDESKRVYVLNGHFKKSCLAVITSKIVKINHTHSAQWEGCKEDINLIGVYKISAGVDLSKIKYEFQGKTILVSDVEPVLISCKRLSLEVQNKSSIWWTNAKAEDRIAVQNALDRVAKEHAAINREVLKEAKKSFIEQLQLGLGMESTAYHFMAAPSQ